MAETYGWNTNAGGSTEQQFSRNTWENVRKTLNMFTDFNSPYYTAYANYINKATPGVGAGSFLSLLQSSGGNYAGSMAQALQLKSQADRQRRDTINTGLTGYSANMAQMIPQLLGIQAGVAGNQLTNQTQKEIAGMQGSPWQIFAQPLGFLGAQGLGSLFSSGSAATAATTLPALASDIRFKENITYTDETTKDGIPIVEFNYKGIPNRFRGVIAQDVEKVRPDAVIEVNGYKYVYYGRL